MSPVDRGTLRRVRRALIGAGAVAVASLPLAPAAQAEDPCDFGATILCHFMPVAPDLEGDVDLTVDQPPADPAVPLPESRPPADICANGCV